MIGASGLVSRTCQLLGQGASARGVQKVLRVQIGFRSKVRPFSALLNLENLQTTRMVRAFSNMGMSRGDRDRMLDKFTSAREFSDYFWSEALQSVRDRNSKSLLEQLNKLKGFRHGFTHSDPTLKKFMGEFPLFFSKMTEADAVKCMDALYHIGIKDVEFWGAIYDHLRRSLEYYSFGALLRAFNIWEDNGLFGYKMEYSWV